jgi:hypothetical protein
MQLYCLLNAVSFTDIGLKCSKLTYTWLKRNRVVDNKVTGIEEKYNKLTYNKRTYSKWKHFKLRTSCKMQ